MAQDPFYTPLPLPQTLVDGIFKGGGTGGIVYIGSLMALARNGIWFKRTAGTSAGSITGSIIAAGYDANECDYLAAPSGVRSGAPDNLPAGAKPLNYRALLDVPLSPGEVTLESRRNNLIYQAINGPNIDELLKLVVALPSIEPFVTNIVNQVLAVIPRKIGPFKVKVGPFKAKAGPFKVHFPQPVGKVSVGPWEIDTPRYDVEVGPFPVPVNTLAPLIRAAVEGVLKGYPKVLKLVEAGVLTTDDLRHAFADAVMSTLLITDPLLVIYLNFVGDGGVVKGDAFLEALRHILENKVKRSPVRFVDLPLEFACAATDVTTRTLRVYSTKTTPEMEVAEAVRRSMAIPFFFEPRRDQGHEIMDGGVIDNFPVGFYLAKNNGYFENSDADMQRVKMGFAPGVSAGLGPPMEFERMLAEWIPGGRLPMSIVEVTCLSRAVNTGVSNMQDSPLLEAMLQQLKNVAKYYDITGNLEGHSAIDFDITPGKFKSMCSKGWTGAIPKIQQGVTDGNLNLSGPLVSADPYP